LNLDVEYYMIQEDAVVAVRDTLGTRVYLEARGTGEYEFIQGGIPSETTRDDSVFEDVD
jgi:hypothetical protein